MPFESAFVSLDCIELPQPIMIRTLHPIKDHNRSQVIRVAELKECELS